MALPTFAAFDADFQIAESLRADGRLREAYTRYGELLAHRLAQLQQNPTAITALTAEDVVVIDRLAGLAILFGDLDASDALLEGMADLCRQANNLYPMLYATLKRLQLFLDIGRLDAANALLREIGPIIGDVGAIDFTTGGFERWERGRRWPGIASADRAVLFAQLYLALGSLLAASGQYECGLLVLARGIAFAVPPAPHLACQVYLPLRLATAAAHLEQGALDAAADDLGDLSSRIDEKQMTGFAVQWLELSGKLAFLRGEFGVARERYSHARKICRSVGLLSASIRATINLAHLLIYLNQTALAQDMLSEARAQALELGDYDSVRRSLCLLQLADARTRSLRQDVPIESVFVLWRASRPDATERQLGPLLSLPDLAQSADYLDLFNDRALGFQWSLGQGDLVNADHRLSDMHAVFGNSDSQLVEVRLRVMDGMLAFYQGEVGKADLIFEETRCVLDRLGLMPELWQTLRFLGWCLERQGRPEDERRVVAEEAAALLDTLTNSLEAEQQAIFLLNKWTADEEYIASQISELNRIRDSSARAPWLWRLWQTCKLMYRLHALMQHIDRYKDALAKNPQRHSVLHPQQPKWWALPYELLMYPRDRATLSFLVLPDSVVIIRLGWMALDFGVTRMGRAQLRTSVGEWHGAISGHRKSQHDETESVGMGVIQEAGSLYPTGTLETVRDARRRDWVSPDQVRQARRVAQALASALKLPEVLEQTPGRVRALTIIPDDSLHGFPFAAIEYHGEYLAERYALSVGYKVTEQQLRRKVESETTSLVVAVSQGADGLVALPGVRREFEAVRLWMNQHVSKVEALIDDAADKESVVSQLSAATLFHIACHGTFVADNMDQTGLILVPQYQHTELLSLRELSRLDLTRLRHVVLSSCWGADHYILPGRWVISLPERLWRAGAQSILGCLWPVDDRVAAPFMASYYSYLDRYPRDEALRQTQLDCLHNRLLNCYGIDTSSPAYWAGFNLHGDHGWLKFQRHS